VATDLHYYGTGKRKTAVARVYLRPGTGEMSVNGRTINDYFPSDVLRSVVRQPLMAVEMVDRVDVKAFIKGGGNAGQAGAMRHGIARALLTMNAELRPTLKQAGFLTRDARKKERKKYGQPGARARFQFSKR
jgi:small subunit ribosomal protein S9